MLNSCKESYTWWYPPPHHSWGWKLVTMIWNKRMLWDGYIFVFRSFKGCCQNIPGWKNFFYTCSCMYEMAVFQLHFHRIIFCSVLITTRNVCLHCSLWICPVGDSCRGIMPKFTIWKNCQIFKFYEIKLYMTPFHDMGVMGDKFDVNWYTLRYDTIILDANLNKNHNLKQNFQK